MVKNVLMWATIAVFSFEIDRREILMLPTGPSRGKPDSQLLHVCKTEVVVAMVRTVNHIGLNLKVSQDVFNFWYTYTWL